MPERQRLTSLLRRRYGVVATSIAPGERGTVAETYVVQTADARYFAKLVPFSRYADGLEMSLPIHRALAEAGIDSIGRPIATLDGDLLVRLERHFLVVLEFLDGVWTEDYPFEPFVELIARVHETRLDIDGDRERFLDDNLAVFEERLDALLSTTFRHPLKRELQASIRPRVGLLRARVERYRALMRSLQGLRDLPMVITHHDGPGNVLLAPDGRVQVVDWDDVMWAPRERDTWFHLLNPKDTARFLPLYRHFVPDYEPDERFVAFYLHGWYFEDLEYFFDRVTGPRTSAGERERVMHSFRTRMDWLEEGLRVREAGEWPLDGQARPSAS
jgi:spectinomycin phosphotransferase